MTHGELEEDTDFLVGIYLFVERKVSFQRAPAGELIRTFPIRVTFCITYNSKPMTYTFACSLSELLKSNFFKTVFEVLQFYTSCAIRWCRCCYVSVLFRCGLQGPLLVGLLHVHAVGQLERCTGRHPLRVIRCRQAPHPQRAFLFHTLIATTGRPVRGSN